MIEYKIINPFELIEFRRIRLSGLKQSPEGLLDYSDTGEEWKKPLTFHLDMIHKNIAVGVYEDGILGGMSLATIYSPKGIRHKASSWGTWIEPSFRRHAKGIDLLTAVIDELIRRDVHICNASVISNDNLSSMFAKQMHINAGFIELHTEKDGIKINDGYKNVTFYIKYLMEQQSTS